MESTQKHKEESPNESFSLEVGGGGGSGGGKKPILSTSSPEGIQVASQITPARLANLLIRKGPLPIRHITSQLAVEVHGFEYLSLSKQRRLIMAAMEQADEENNVVFEKIGWGQWAVRNRNSDYIVTEGKEKPEEGVKKPLNVHELRNQANVKLGWSKKQSQEKNRRESITNKQSNLHNLKLPNEKLANASNALELDSESDYALSDVGDDDDDGEVEEDEDDEGDSDDGLFAFDHDEDKHNAARRTRSPPIKFANRVPLKLSPPPGTTTTNGRRSSSSNGASISKNTHAHRGIFNRSRLNSFENLDNYILSSAKTSSVSVNSPPPAVTSTLPISSWNNNYLHNAASPDGMSGIAQAISAAGRRKSSFNESHLRSTLSSSLPKQTSPNLSGNTLSPPPGHKNGINGFNRNALRRPYDDSHHANSTSNIPKASDNMSDTDEEDWASIGAESLRNRDKPRSKNASTTTAKKGDQSDEKAAAIALVDLMSV